MVLLFEGGYHCYEVSDPFAEEALDECVAHCQDKLGDEFAVAVIEKVGRGTCCCSDAGGCACHWDAGFPKYAIAEASNMGFSVADTERCPTSLVEGGYQEQCRPFRSFSGELPSFVFPFTPTLFVVVKNLA